MSKIYQIYGRDAREMTLRLLEAANAFQLVPQGGSVALKPNLVIAGTPESVQIKLLRVIGAAFRGPAVQAAFRAALRRVFLPEQLQGSEGGHLFAVLTGQPQQDIHVMAALLHDDRAGK